MFWWRLYKWLHTFEFYWDTAGMGIEQSCHKWSAAWLRWHQSYLLSQIIMLVPFYNQESQQTDIKEINSYSVYTTSSRCTLTEFRINAFLISLTCKLTVCQVNALRRKRQMLLVQLLALLTKNKCGIIYHIIWERH